jgi:predicted nucleic acid-binding protein
VKALLDTNILIDYLNGIDAARTEINRYTMPCISPITWMEVMAGVNPETEVPVRQFLNRFTQIDINSQVAEGAVAIRRQHRVKLPDAIIWASAKSISALLVSRNKKDFPPDEPGVRIPYEL